ncbi:MAG: hypothetical protein KAT85_01495 [candidate division Zixibacteria bacterium]|nr:hypothetical protein [candidate division Zixibacteria bacterium]
MNEIPEIECSECGWQGDVSELICHPDDNDKPVDESRFNVCPDCGAIDKSENYED